MLKEFIPKNQHHHIKNFKYINVNHSLLYDKLMSPLTDYVVNNYFSKNIA